CHIERNTSIRNLNVAWGISTKGGCRMISASATFRPRGDLGRFIETHVTPALHKWIEAGCVLIEDRAKEKCPVDTGNLQSHITHKVEDLAKTIRGTVFVDGVDYAAYVE